MHFYENDTAESDGHHLYFQGDPDGCYNDEVGLKTNRHVIAYDDSWCFKDKMVCQ